MKITGIVLAGGKSSRFGSDKATACFKEKEMIMYSIDLLDRFCTRTLISGDPQLYGTYGLTCIPDKYTNIGPIGGICTALEESTTDMNIIVTCDMPLVSEGLIYRLLHHHKKGKITVFHQETEKIYPFPGVYERRHLSFLQEMICNKDYLIKHLILTDKGNLIQLQEAELQYMANINTYDELNRINRNSH